MPRLAPALRRVRAFWQQIFDVPPGSDGRYLRLRVMEDYMQISVLEGDYDDN